METTLLRPISEKLESHDSPIIDDFVGSLGNCFDPDDLRESDMVELTRTLEQAYPEAADTITDLWENFELDNANRVFF